MCVWEDPSTSMSCGKASSNRGCPIYNQQNPFGEITFAWHFDEDGMYLVEYDFLQNINILILKQEWYNLDPEHKDILINESMFYFSITNNMKNDVQVHCLARLDYAFVVRAWRPNKDSNLFEKTLNLMDNANDIEPWVCTFVVSNTDGSY